MKRFFLLLICIMLTMASYARFTALCDIQYETEDGWSDTFRAEVDFLSGCELQQHSNEVYAVIWFSEDKCAVIKLDVIHISVNFKMKDFKSIYWVESYKDGKQVNTEHERQWRIAAKQITGKFIDNNVSQGLF